jgi:hypothetical protein
MRDVAVKTYHVVLLVTNLAHADAILFPHQQGQASKKGMLLKNNVIVHLKMITQQSSPVTYTVIDAKTKKAFYINGTKISTFSPS